MQYRAVKTIFGWDKGYDKICEEHNIATLKERRIEAVSKFVIKLGRSERFSHWFERNDSQQNTRGYKKYIEKHSRTDAYYRSPINSYTK